MWIQDSPYQKGKTTWALVWRGKGEYWFFNRESNKGWYTTPYTIHVIVAEEAGENGYMNGGGLHPNMIRRNFDYEYDTYWELEKGWVLLHEDPVTFMVTALI